MQENFDARNNAAKIKPQKFLWIYFCNNNFCVKNFCAKDFCVTIFCLFILATVYSAAYIFVYLIKMTTLIKYTKKTLRELWFNKCSKIFAHLFLYVFF